MSPERSPSVGDVLDTARTAFEQAAGRRVETVSSVAREDGGWRLAFDVVELARIPDSTSLLGSYEILADGDGNLLGYERIRRFYRNRADEDA